VRTFHYFGESAVLWYVYTPVRESFLYDLCLIHPLAVGHPSCCDGKRTRVLHSGAPATTGVASSCHRGDCTSQASASTARVWGSARGAATAAVTAGARAVVAHGHRRHRGGGALLVGRVVGGVGCWAGALVCEPSLLQRVVFVTGAFPMALAPGCLLCRTC